MNGPLVAVSDLWVRAGDRAVLQGVDFTLRAGESIAVAGASGSGKTTTALAVLGHLRDGLRHTAGTVRLAGRDMLPVPPPGLRGGLAGYLGQDPSASLNPYRRVSSILLTALGRPPRAERGDSVARLLTRVGLDPGLAGRYPHQLSGGQQQRVALASALARRPRLLVLDEPTSALDADAARDIRGELIGLRNAGVSLLWITHDLDAVADAVDRVLVFADGHVVDDAPHADLLASPVSPQARALVAATAAQRPPRPASASDTPPAVPLLRVRDLTVRYPGGADVLREVSLDAYAGRCLVVVGASGAGKSTLARSLAGLHPPTRGTILLGNTALAPDIRSRTQAERAALQLVAQDPAGALHPRQDVHTALTRPLRLFHGIRGRGELTAEITRLLDMVRLPADHARRMPGELSGGERQRVALARALAARPRLLICDEVTAALDAVTGTAILELLAGLSDSHGLGIVLITHSSQVTRYLADEVLHLTEGRPGSRGLIAGIPRKERV
ncbi:ABC transporter ATP-binding protein [Streptomyces litchfieldiae]|uniref:ATP-binding cassette domain-containing protein n=1 Tax=Streptomyces litchfieldiae TaxID=3075543 RepID=A0ABU2MVT4_9ACTN|nr:ATP-binding cassette domain-containing protein [Streptomyces sp. DSM 44938]MDT0345705.1 ATP-binding cassette domain-containing protein [Streptomyces sp. DSM 44938]